MVIGQRKVLHYMKGIPVKRQLALLLLFTLGFDQLSKEAARFLGFTVVYNAGISFNMFSFVQAEIFIGLMIAVLVGLWYGYQNRWLQHPVLSGMFFGAALSNIFDRVWYGAVRDWLPVPGFSVSNNFADWVMFTVLFVMAVQLVRRRGAW